MDETMWKVATPVISYVGTALIKWLFSALDTKIPGWIKPIIAGLLGTASTVVTGVPPVEGFVLGGGAPMIYESINRATTKPAEGNA